MATFAMAAAAEQGRLVLGTRKSQASTSLALAVGIAPLTRASPRRTQLAMAQTMAVHAQLHALYPELQLDVGAGASLAALLTFSPLLATIAARGVSVHGDAGRQGARRGPLQSGRKVAFHQGARG